MRRAGGSLGAVASALLITLSATPGSADDRRVLESLEVEPSDDGYTIEIGFGFPIQYIRHAPSTHGTTLEVQVSTVSYGSGGPSVFSSESLRPSARGTPLTDVVYEGGRTEGPVVVAHFSRDVEFSVSQKTSLTSLVVVVRDKRRALEIAREQARAQRKSAPEPAPLPPPTPQAPAPSPETAVAQTPPAPTPPRPTPAESVAATATPAPRPAASAADADKIATLTASGRAALERGDLDAALSELSQAVSLPEAAASPEAKELLGVTRERRGQLAHAKAEYEEYLASYPEGEGAARVRQRLDAMLASQLAKLPPSQDPGAAASGEPRGPAFEQYGSLSLAYRRYVHTADSIGSLPTDSSIQADGTWVLRGTRGNLALRGQVAGAYRFDLLEGMDENDTRISAVYLDVAQIEGPFAMTLGRQPGNTAGVLSRFDGVRLRGRVSEHFRVSAVGGLPVDYYNSDSIETNRYVYGLALDFEGLFDGLDGQLFAIQQRATNIVDRTAIGVEVRWTDATKFISTYFDYDIGYQELNTALIVGNWSVRAETRLSLLFDYRKSPILTTSNALFGQPVNELSELQELYSNDEIRQLARDRTPTSYYASLGGTQQLTKRVQLALDVSGSKLTATPTSGGVTGTPATGWEFAANPQLLVTNLLKDGDIATLGFRYFDGATTTTYSLLLNERFPVTDKLRLAPRLRLDWRKQVGSDEFVQPPGTGGDPFFQPDPIRSGQLTVRGYLGAEYRIWKLTADMDCGVEWNDGTFTGESSIDYSLWFGLRYDF